MKLTKQQSHELKLTQLGGGGMYVNKHLPVYRTYLALARRGLVKEREEIPFYDNSLAWFELTDAGRERHLA